MTLARTLCFILVGVLLGAAPLPAHTEDPGGDGGVVILPAGSPITSSDPRMLDGIDAVAKLVVPTEGSIHMRLQDMADAHAVLIVGDISIPVRVVAQEIEIDADTVENLVESGVTNAKLLAVSSDYQAVAVSLVFKEGATAKSTE